MSTETLFPKTIDELKGIIKNKEKALYYSSATSTVIPFDFLDQYYDGQAVKLVNLGSLPKSMELNADILTINGPVTWKEASDYLKSFGHEIMVSPTEELASVLAGAATSATGEKSFAYGTLRDQIQSITYIGHDGKEYTLTNNDLKSLDLTEYQNSFAPYSSFKNAPFPRLQKETDLMIGTEGQLGIIIAMDLKVKKSVNSQHFFMLIPKWENGLNKHLEVFQKIQNFRGDVITCEFTDSNSFKFLPPEDQINKEQDVFFFEIQAEFFEEFFERFLTILSFFDENKVFEIKSSEFHRIRSAIPRSVNEENNAKGLKKLGTDIQASADSFKALLSKYQDLTKLGVQYNLFGHFGDAHLHFNFAASKKDVDRAENAIHNLYKDCLSFTCSPFAEHGIGLIKQKFIKDFWTEAQYNTFKKLKQQYDPDSIFFPKGFMELAK